MRWKSCDVFRFGLDPLLQGEGSLALVSCRSGRYNLHLFSDVLGLVFSGLYQIQDSSNLIYLDKVDCSENRC